MRTRRSLPRMVLATLIACAPIACTPQMRTRPAPYARPTAGYTPEQLRDIQRNCGDFGMPEKRAQFGRTDYVTRHGYVLEHNASDDIALWVEEYIPAGQPGPDRPGVGWKRDPQLPDGIGAVDSDYAGWSGTYDRGHMAPNGDFGTDEAKKETFFLSNAVPQDANNNKGIWKGLEERVRDWVAERGEAYVITGGFFYDPADDPEAGGTAGDGVIDYYVIGAHNVAVPTHLFKIVLAPKSPHSDQWEAIAFVIENKSYSSPYDYAGAIRSINWIEARTGLNFFPNLDADPAEELRIEGTKPAAPWPR